MRFKTFIFIILLLAPLAPQAQESATLTTPVSVGTRSMWQVNYLHIDLLPSPRIVVEVQDNLGNIVRDEHTSVTATTGASLLNSLNTANLGSNSCGGTPVTACSLIARIIKHLQSEGKIGAGSVTGTPQ